MVPTRVSALTRRTLQAALPTSFLPIPGLAEAVRPAHWAEKLELAGVPNLYRMAPNLYRSAQPTAEGFRNLQKLGVRSVISTRQTVNDAPLAVGTDLDLTRIPMKTRHVAEKSGAKVVAALQALEAALLRGPVLVHCHHGADRTGLIAALYRMIHQSWTRDEALLELHEGGFGFHPMWGNIPKYLQGVDLADLRERIAG